MSTPSDELAKRAERYCTARGMLLKDALGYGKDGYVFATDKGTAVKVHTRRTTYESERDCYLRLAEHRVLQVAGHNVPHLVRSDDELLLLEISIVWPPYILDFAGARLDFPLDFPAEVLEEWERERAEEFGEKWPRVKILVHLMKAQYGIILTDIHPRNISFGEGSEK